MDHKWSLLNHGEMWIVGAGLVTFIHRWMSGARSGCIEIISHSHSGACVLILLYRIYWIHVEQSQCQWCQYDACYCPPGPMWTWVLILDSTKLWLHDTVESDFWYHWHVFYENMSILRIEYPIDKRCYRMDSFLLIWVCQDGGEGMVFIDQMWNMWTGLKM